MDGRVRPINEPRKCGDAAYAGPARRILSARCPHLESIVHQDLCQIGMAGLSLHRENLSHKEPDGAIIELEHLLDSTFYPRNLPALDEASSDAVKATAPSPLADTMYHKHDYQERDRIEVKQDIIRASSKLYVPWVLRRMPLVGFAMAATSLIAVLEVLAHISAQHQGLGISNRKNHYLATYAPTAGR